MASTPHLPTGYHPQPSFHHEEGATSYDFYRVYDTHRHLDPLRSFWLLTVADDPRGPMPPRSRALAFVHWANHYHKGSLAFSDFANPLTKLGDVHTWLAAVESKDLVTVPELQH